VGRNWCMMQNLIFKIINFLIKLKFPKVEKISTETLSQWQVDTSKIQPLLLDARTESEYAVSHLKTATPIDLTRTDTLNFPVDTPIVVYCSVGYRSAIVAEKLQKAGFSQVFNLSGGIFEWANEQRPMFQLISDELHLTTSVHPYNATWGRLLRIQNRSR
jgi:rhodanese-related sulfurtransferase